MECKKLVRDNICFIIESEGGTVNCRILNDDEYKTELIRKMHEETEEYAKDCNLEELADMWEVFRSIIRISGYKFADILRASIKKREEKGGFVDKIYLESFENE
jgi:predicted house-cleaning noncanonical NTP pyrophosphatase (MazG superfamily)